MTSLKLSRKVSLGNAIVFVDGLTRTGKSALVESMLLPLHTYLTSLVMACKNATYDGNDFRNMYMPSFLQAIIDHLSPMKAVCVERGWLEIDSVEDLEAYERHGVVVASSAL